MLIAMTRPVSESIDRCELTHIARDPIDPERAQAQHRTYEAALSVVGCRLERLPALPELPDAVFVEDAALVLDELAIITRPGAASRRSETATVAEALRPYRSLAYIESPGTLDGGDVLRVDQTIFVGRSSRTNRAGIEQLVGLLEPFGYSVQPVDVRRCLHLKTAVTQVDSRTLLINRAWLDLAPFEDYYTLIDVAPDEPLAANALWVNGTVIHPAAYAQTRQRLEQQGISVQPVDVSELSKAEGGVTCCSLVFSPYRSIS